MIPASESARAAAAAAAGARHGRRSESGSRVTEMQASRRDASLWHRSCSEVITPLLIISESKKNLKFKLAGESRYPQVFLDSGSFKNHILRLAGSR
jgi:hypothetical protein